MVADLATISVGSVGRRSPDVGRPAESSGADRPCLAIIPVGLSGAVPRGRCGDRGHSWKTTSR